MKTLGEGVVGVGSGGQSVSSPFLITTAMQEFWDVSGPVVFLGEWCRTYSCRHKWKALEGDLLPHPWEGEALPSQAHLYVGEVCARLLPQLSLALNDIHGCRYSDRYWKIVIGSWLYFYVSTLYERWVSIENALKTYPDLVTIGLDEESFVTPRNSREFGALVKTDCFNLQIYTQVLAWLGVPLPRKPAPEAPEPLDTDIRRSRALSLSLASIPQILLRRLLPRYPRVFLWNSYFSRKAQLGIVARTWGRVWPLMDTSSKIVDEPLDMSVRKELGRISLNSDMFEQFLAHSIVRDCPQSFIEGYATIEKDLRRTFPTEPKAIFSANSWHTDDLFKLWAAESAEKGAILVGTQHGPRAGSAALNSVIAHELAITDIYFSWGWERSGCRAAVTPMPATRLVGQTVLGASNQGDGVLWGATAEPRYPALFPLPHFPSRFSEYLRWQTLFAAALSPDVSSQLKFRPHREDLGWDIVPRLRDCGFDFPVDKWEVPFTQSIKECRLYVCDHFSTTSVETLTANIPTILFWDPKMYVLRPDSEPYFDKLRATGILFHDPEAAAYAVNEVYDDVELWWNAASRQASIRQFLYYFARTADDGVKRWAVELEKISKTDTA